MESLEFDVRRGEEPWDRTGFPGPPGGRTGPQPRARQNYPGRPAPAQVPMPGGPPRGSGPMVGLSPRAAGRHHQPPPPPPSGANPYGDPYSSGGFPSANGSVAFGGDYGDVYGYGANNGGRGADPRNTGAQPSMGAPSRGAPNAGPPSGPMARAPWDQPVPPRYPARQGAVAPRGADGNSVSLASRMLSDAERQAEQIRQQAAAQASAMREQAEMEAARVRTAVQSMQTELNEFATRVSNTLPNQALSRVPTTDRPAINPATRRPPTRPNARPHTGPMARPGTGPMERPAGRTIAPQAGRTVAPLAARTAAPPTARTAVRPTPGQAGKKAASGQGWQRAAMRFAVIATSGLFLVAVAAGAIEIHLHGFDFFVFRSIGAGETGPNGLTENQGPGQPDAPKPTPSDVKAKSSPLSTITVHSGQ